ncbi:APC family permease [Alicyclobacillus sp. ALC3]|uniref:APC family permease n=1 Tax=Alicyclobacillus sp. ALC3 TaxID=2796143 RepID=UPI002379A764|nr:APC family permease [Alicyclobacillus sp. ALC3]WDL98602.1 APC family permease [Alicyclobacillus sp. ALC3]
MAQNNQNKLKRNYLSMVEVLALSVSIVAPTMAMAFNTAPAAGAAGASVPLSFLVGTIAMLLVGVSFFEFSKRIPHSGSVYAYNAQGLGPKTGFVSGWALTATYFAYAAGCAALFGNFANVFLLHFGLHVPEWLLVFVGMAVVWFFSYRDVRLSTRAALLLEGISILVVLVLCFVIVGKGGNAGNTAVPFSMGSVGLSGVGAGMIFAVLSFAGFEGAATLAEEAKNPHRAVPLAIYGTVIAAGIFYVFVSYSEVIGFGAGHVAKLAGSSAPLDTLASSYIGSAMGTFVDFAAMISAFACSLGSANAASRMLFALGRDGALPRFLSRVHDRHGTPHVAVNTISILGVVLYLIIGLPAGASNFYAYFGTIGTFTLLVAYLLINVAAIRYFGKRKSAGYYSVVRHLIVPVVGFIVLLWPIYGNIYPVPSFPYNLFPYIALAWIVIGIIIINAQSSRDPGLASRIVRDLDVEVGG